jgi:nucleoside-diphosphate-sugar epimerase
VIYGDGEQSRDFTFISDCVQANLLACHSPEANFSREPVGTQAFNIACGSRVTINQLYKELTTLLNTEILPHYTDPRPGDVRHSLADIQQAKDRLTYQPQFPIREGLQKTVIHYSNSA